MIEKNAINTMKVHFVESSKESNTNRSQIW